MKRVLKTERAQSLVEFALVLPIFLILILATIDFGWGLRAYITATNSAREGARTGAVGEAADKITQSAIDRSAGMLSSGNLAVEWRDKNGALTTERKPGYLVTVKVNYNYNYITPLGGMLSAFTGGTLPSPLPMKVDSTMRVE